VNIMCKRVFIYAAVAGLVLALSPVASAEVMYSFFWADMDASTNTIDGSGYIDGDEIYQGEFFEYPQPDGPTWSNAWMFNGGPIEGWKWIEYMIELGPTAPDIITAEVAINWSNENWLDADRPPTDPAEDGFIVRETIFNGVVQPGFLIENRGNPIIIPDYNPLWVSYDIRVLDYAGTENNDPFMGGDIQIWHEHVPEPATMALLALGGLMIRRRKRA